MNCELCGKEIPDNVTFCPSCGLPVDFEEHRPTVEDHFPDKTSGNNQEIGGEPTACNDPYSDYGGDLATTLEHTYGQAPQEFAPGTLPDFQQDYGYPERWEASPSGHSPGTTRRIWNNVTAFLSIALALALLVTGGIFAYSKIHRPSSPLQEANALLEKYFNAVESGDTATVSSLHAPDMQPSQGALAQISYNGTISKTTYSDLIVKELSRTSSEMEVEIFDGEVSHNVSGTEQTTAISKFTRSQSGRATTSKVKFKNVDGKWLVNEPDIVKPFQVVPL